VTVCVGSCLTSCAQLDKERAKTNPDALKIAFSRFMCHSFLEVLSEVMYFSLEVLVNPSHTAMSGLMMTSISHTTQQFRD
jgi:hypothetical protein